MAAVAEKKKRVRKPANPAQATKPTAGGQIEIDELKALEEIRDHAGRDRTSISFLVRLAIIRLIADVNAKRVDFTKSLDDYRVAAGFKPEKPKK